MIQNYLTYLQYINTKFRKFFDEQKDYIYCKKGCALCCKQAQFPYSEIEFKLLSEGIRILRQDIKEIVFKNINNILNNLKEHKKTNPDKKFRYDCPLLINDECVVYIYRGLVCRTFGLMSFKPDSDEKPKIPFCSYQGLNYSNVLDDTNNNISADKYASLGIKNEPQAYNIDYSTLINEDIAEPFGFKFGEIKPLIEWFT